MSFACVNYKQFLLNQEQYSLNNVNEMLSSFRENFQVKEMCLFRIKGIVCLPTALMSDIKPWVWVYLVALLVCDLSGYQQLIHATNLICSSAGMRLFNLSVRKRRRFCKAAAKWRQLTLLGFLRWVYYSSAAANIYWVFRNADKYRSCLNKVLMISLEDNIYIRSDPWSSFVRSPLSLSRPAKWL